MAENDAVKKAKEFHETLKSDVENRIFQKFPERIILFNELLNNPAFCLPQENIKCTLNIPKTTEVEKNEKNVKEDSSGVDSNSYNKNLEQMLIPSNKNITEVNEILKPHFKELAEDINALKMWLSLLIPKIEDGNNFGVSVQENVLELIQTNELNSTQFLEQIFNYHNTRAQLIKKVLKYPFVEDYRRAIEDMDDIQYLQTTINLHNIRNCYSSLHDMISKNLEKIKVPRTSNTDSLY